MKMGGGRENESKKIVDSQNSVKSQVSVSQNSRDFTGGTIKSAMKRGMTLQEIFYE